MEDKLKETLYIAYTKAFDETRELFDDTEDFELNVKSLNKLAVSHALHEVIKQAGMLEDYTIWLMRRDVENED